MIMQMNIFAMLDINALISSSIQIFAMLYSIHLYLLFILYINRIKIKQKVNSGQLDDDLLMREHEYCV